MKLNRVSGLLLGTSLIINAALALVGPFFPQEAEDKGVDINIIGYIFSAYPFSFVIISLIMPKILNKYSQRFMFIVGSITYALSVIGFGLLIFVDNELFLAMAITCRVLQGASNSVVYTTAYSVFSMQYEGNDIMQMNSYFKVTLGAGLVIGLLTGTLLYMVGGYCLPFIVFGVFFLCFVPCVIGYFPSKIEVSSDLKERLCANTNSEQQKSGQFIDFSSNQNIVNCKDQRFYSIRPSIKENLDDGNLRHKYSFDQEKRETLDVEHSNSSQRDSKRIKFEFHQDMEAGSQSLAQSIVTQIIMKCLILAILFLSLLNFAPAILSKRLEELKIHEYLYGLIFAIP